MATITTRVQGAAPKGSPLTNVEVDDNFLNLNTDKLEKSGGAMTGAITTNSTFDGVDVGARDAVLTTTTTTANAALPKAGGAMTGAITTNSTFDGRDVATDGAKLDNIETSADVTDTANVTASGALMDSELASITSVKALNQGVATTDDPTFTNTHLAAIDATIAATAVDTFVYDTRKDSDGGAWRKRTQHTSWYNETLNTTTRGSRKEFPVVAVIVAEINKVTIYDGDDPAMPMWMVFNQAGWNVTLIIGAANTSTSMINGKLAVGTAPNAQGLVLIDFILDRSQAHLTASNYGGVDRTSLALRNAPGHTFSAGTALGDPTGNIASNAVNDVAMTVLPNAPIDPATGLPVPTIAVATNGGVSVIKDNGTVVDISQTTNYTLTYEVAFTKDNKVAYIMDSVNSSRVMRVDSIPASDFVVTSNQLVQGSGEEFYGMSDFGSGLNLFLSKDNNSYIRDIVVSNDNNRIIGCDNNIAIVAPNLANPSKGSVAYITPDYNTGWMHGDIKLATLSDTDATDVVGTDLATGYTTVGNWSKQPSISISESSGTLSISGNGTGSNVYFWLPLTVEANTEYVLDITINPGYMNGLVVNTSLYTLAGSLVTINNVTGGYTFNSGSNTSVNLQGYQAPSGTTQITSMTLKKAEQDRSVNGNGLQVFGTVTKTPVATGADLVGYSGFSASNYLEQPYNSDLDFGTGDFCYQWWLKTTDKTNYPYVVSRSNASGSDGVRIYIMPSGTMRFVIVSQLVESIADVATGFWNHICVKRVNGTVEIFINGTLNASGSLTTTVNSTVGALRIGSFFGGNVMDGSIALFRISATAPTAEQIAKIYNDEKPLFQENAQATLYGTSDAVTALAYDDDTELLHAGTSSGRSVFQGLRRVSNTTDAITTSISASNSIIVEE